MKELFFINAKLGLEEKKFFFGSRLTMKASVTFYTFDNLLRIKDRFSDDKGNIFVVEKIEQAKIGTEETLADVLVTSMLISNKFREVNLQLESNKYFYVKD